ncbi:hypothetical protein EIP86_010205 [Pleurotus ostreatoroseus]|nr:hypothetical protein EIP86_010205 [Pleurotus ostreatoroseus]
MDPVLVVGSGLSGLAAALYLAKNGVPVRIIERDSEFHCGQRGSALMPRTLEQYHFLGVLPDILNEGMRPLPRCMYGMPEGRVPIKIFEMLPWIESTPDVPFRNAWIIGQAHNEEILRRHLAKHSVHVELNTELVGYEHDDEKVVAHVIKRKGGEEISEDIPTPFLIGADGAASTVRKTLQIPFVGETLDGQRMLLVDIEINGLNLECNLVWKLSLVYHGLANRSLLATYSEERVPAIKDMLPRTTAILTDMVHHKENDTEKDFSLTAHVRPKILNQLGVNCRWSPVVFDEQPEAQDAVNAGAYLDEDPSILFAGDRAPEAPGLLKVVDGAILKEETTSLFNIFSPTAHTVLIFVPDVTQAVPFLLALDESSYSKAVVVLASDSETSVAVQSADIVVLDRDGHAHHAYPPVAKGFPVIVVRPDGVVGAVIKEPQNLHKYFTQALYATVFIARYLDLFYEWVSLYNFMMKVFFIASSVYILYLMKFKFRPTQDPSIDTFRVEYLLGPAVVLSLLFNYKFSFTEILWSFSIFLESVAILPQLFMLQRTGEAETITTHYLAALGAYWSEGIVDPIAVIAGLVQTALYLDFFYVYFTKVTLGKSIVPTRATCPFDTSACDLRRYDLPPPPSTAWLRAPLDCHTPRQRCSVHLDTPTVLRTCRQRNRHAHYTHLTWSFTRSEPWNFESRMLLSGLFLSTLALLPAGVLGALDETAKMANRTIERTVALRTHSIYAPYIDQDLQNRWWDFGADAIVITGDSSHLYGDGMAVWLTEERAQPGPVFGSIDKFHGLGIFLDTYANARHGYAFPRIVGMLGNGVLSYDHSDDGEKTKIGACSANFRRTNVATKLRITYIKEGYLKVQIQYKAWDDWTDCFTIEGIELPSSPYLGFSALTGDVSDNHDIISISTSTAILSHPDAPRDKLRSNLPSASAKSSWLWTITKIVLFVGFVVGALWGYKTYALRQAGGKGFNMGSMGSMGMGRVPGVGGGLYSDAKRF